MIDGKPYCDSHYAIELRNRFVESYNKWDGSEETIGRLKYNFSRYIGDIIPENFINGLSTARVRDRGENYTKTNDGLTFEIDRHPGAFEFGHGRIVRQKYSFTNKTESFELLFEKKTKRFF